ncbi:hypothetical protein [Paenirhodobacter sp.]|uniref:hypothetical protein n=1 Tax=Paenirhodobacter sp. TaxID=1965326 RepID=UPI003B3EE6D1
MTETTINIADEMMRHIARATDVQRLSGKEILPVYLDGGSVPCMHHMAMWEGMTHIDLTGGLDKLATRLATPSP